MDRQTGSEYIGEELELFELAVRWKKYFGAHFKPYIKGAVAEVGSGRGANVPYLLNAAVSNYLCIEPDSRLVSTTLDKIASGSLPKICQVKQGFLEPIQIAYDTILYIDVLEHINNDRQELEKAANALRPGGFLCILVPANPKDFSAFDKAVGHYRRYSKKQLLALIPPSLEVHWCRYLDAFGAVASKVNQLFLKQSKPTIKQVKFWDQYLVPFSRIIDKPTGYNRGKSLLLVAQKKW